VLVRDALDGAKQRDALGLRLMITEETWALT
jgi:hypothetical protein